MKQFLQISSHRSFHSTLRVIITSCAALVLGMGSPHPVQATLTPQDVSPDWSALWYSFNGFNVPMESFPLTITFVGTGPAGLTPVDIEYAIQNSIQTWNAVGCTSASLRFGGMVSTLDQLSPGHIPVVFAELGTRDLPPCLIEDQIASTSFGCLRQRHAAVFLNASQYDWVIAPEPYQEYYTVPQSGARLKIDLESVLTHELGHVLGLGHTDHPRATMAPRYLPDGAQRILSSDDKLAVCELYNNFEDECTTDQHCPENHLCLDFSSFHLCEKEHAVAGDYCTSDLPYCQDLCFMPDASTPIGYCTIHCTESADCPNGFQCLHDDAFESSICMELENLSPTDQTREQGSCSAVRANPAPGFPPLAIVLILWWIWLAHPRKLPGE